MNNKMLLGATALRTLAAGIAFTMSGVAMAQATPPATPAPAADGTVCNSDNPAYNPNTGVCDKPADVVDANDPGQLQRRGADGNTAGPGQEVVITGSRIRIPNLKSIEPTTTVDFRQVRERNFTNVADALNELPNIRGSVTPAGAQGSFGQGTNFVNTYGLGSNRTLTLINGRRFVTSNPATNFGNAAAGTQTDLNIVPDILLDRIDLVSIGGAPVYGSDAIAGVVNVILRSKYRGIEVSGVSGITEQGDNFRYNVSGLVGGDLFDGRLNLTAAVSYDNVTGLVYNSRDYLRQNIGGVPTRRRPPPAAFASSGRRHHPGRPRQPEHRLQQHHHRHLPGRHSRSQCRYSVPDQRWPHHHHQHRLHRGQPRHQPGVLLRRGLAGRAVLRQSGNLQPFNQGVLFGSSTSASLVGGDSSGVFQFNDFAQITSDLERKIGYGFVTFNVTDNIELFAEGTLSKSTANELVQQPTFNSSLFAGASGSCSSTPASRS